MTDLFSVPVGEGRVVYLSYYGSGQEQSASWRAALARLVRTQIWRFEVEEEMRSGMAKTGEISSIPVVAMKCVLPF